LENAGHTAISTNTGDNAVSLYQQHKPDVTVTNISASRSLFGFGVIKAIRQVNPLAKVIGVSLFYNDAYPKRLNELKASGYFTQSIKEESILEILDIVYAGGTFWQEDND
jgi:DNA-binding NarL/FixJ family response regulator